MDAPENTDREKLNPRHRVLIIGTRQLRGITIWPLSCADELKMRDIIIAAAQDFFTARAQSMVKKGSKAETLAQSLPNIDDISAMEYVAFVISQIEKNLAEIIRLSIDEKDVAGSENLLAEMDNTQLSELLLAVFDMNFMAALKNMQSLVGKVREMFQLTRQEPQSVDGTAIALKTSTVSDLPKEA